MSKIKGLQHFSNFFKDYEMDFVIIGGVAAEVILQESDINFRATKDIDMVILTNSSDRLNGRILEYVRVGGYQAKVATKRKQYFRFSEPTNEDFPDILEVFARNESQLDLEVGQYIIPITRDEDNKLSAILLDEEYFGLIKGNCKESDLGLQVLNPLGIICLKARAFRELSERKASGDRSVDSKDIKKHRNDIVRLVQVLEDGVSIDLGPQASLDMQMIIDEINNNLDAKTIKQILGTSLVTKDSLLDAIKKSFSLNL